MTNYFEFFGLPVAPRIDRAALKRTFYANSKRFHPDFHTLADAGTQDDALEQSTLNNQGFKVLDDDDRRLRHLLELRDALGEEGSNKLPQAFLMEMMELNEALAEHKLGANAGAQERIEGIVRQQEDQLTAEVADLLAGYNDATATEADLARLRDYYLKRRYLRRLREQSPEM